MKSHKVTQAELAARIGCSESMLSRFISGKTDKLGDKNIIRIARVFNVSTDFLLGEVDVRDRLDANRERRERYHEVSRSGDDLPIDYGASEDGLRFPDTMNSVLEKQRQKGEFIDSIFNCPYEIHELVTEPYMSKALFALSDDHKEVLYFSAVRMYSSIKIAELRGQTDRNIRKVRNTMLKKIYKKILPYLKEREEKRLPMTMEERAFLAEMREQS